MSVDIRPTPPAQDSARQNVTLQIVSVVMFTFIGYLTIGIPLAVLPGYVHDDLGYGSVLAGLVISLQYLATLLARPYAGRVIDGLGPKRAVLYGMAGSAASGLFMLLSVAIQGWPALSLASLLVGRFIGALRPMLPMVAGMLDMPFGRFLGVSLIAAAGWAVAYLLPGWATGAALRLPLPEGFWSEAGIVAACLAVLVGVVVQASLRRKRWATAVAAALSLVLLLAMTVAWPYLQDLDQGLMTLVQEHRNADLNPVMVVVTRLGDFRTQFIAGALLGGILLLTRQWRPAIFAIGTLVGTALANQTLKTLFARARPEVLAEPLSSFSFPSGHSSASFAFFLTLGVLASRQQPPRWRLTWVLLAVIPSLSIALSRVYLGVHWPSDIVAGALLATTVCAASLWLSQRRESLPALPQRVWWLLLPVCVATLAIAAGWALPEAIARYRPL